MLASFCTLILSFFSAHMPFFLAQVAEEIDRAPAQRVWIIYVVAGVLCGLIVAISIKATKRYQE